MEITELKVVAWMLTSSKRPLNFCASSSCQEKRIFLIIILRIWIWIRIQIHNSCLPSEKTIWSKKMTFYGEITKIKDVSVGMIYNFYFKCLTLICTIEWSKWPTWLPSEKTILLKKDGLSRGNYLSKSCSPDPDKFKTTFEFSVPLPVLEKWWFSRFRHVWSWDPTSYIDKTESQ